MKIGGFQGFSLIDYPGKISAIIFTQGCNFRCPFCHNQELVRPRRFNEPISEGWVFDFLSERKQFLDGVVVSGGEPTLQKDLIPFLGKIKKLGFCVKLDTNGSSPKVLQEVIANRLVDFIAMDVKAPWAKYNTLAGKNINLSHIKESIEMIAKSGLPHLFRTTCVKKYLTRSDFAEIWQMLDKTPSYVMQPFVPSEKVLDKSLLEGNQYLDEEIRSFYLSLGTSLGVFK